MYTICSQQRETTLNWGSPLVALEGVSQCLDLLSPKTSIQDNRITTALPHQVLHQETTCTTLLPLLAYTTTLCIHGSVAVYWTLQRVSPLAHASSTTACHTCCMINCTGSTSQNVSTTNWESQCITVCSTRLLSTWSTAVHQSQTFPADVIDGQPLDITWLQTGSPRTTLPAEHFRSSGLLCRRSDNLELATGQSPWPDAQQQQFQTIAKYGFIISSLPLNTHSAVEMLHDSALYKSIIDIDIDICYATPRMTYRSGRAKWYDQKVRGPRWSARSRASKSLQSIWWTRSRDAARREVAATELVWQKTVVRTVQRSNVVFSSFCHYNHTYTHVQTAMNMHKIHYYY